MQLFSLCLDYLGYYSAPIGLRSKQSTETHILVIYASPENLIFTVTLFVALYSWD